MNVLKRLRGEPMSEIPTANIPLSRKAQELRDQHYIEWAEAIQERDDALEKFRKGEEQCTLASHRIAGLADENKELKQRISDLIVEQKGRIISYQLERDEAVAKCAKLQERLSFAISQFASLVAHLRSDEPLPGATGGLPIPLPTRPKASASKLQTGDHDILGPAPAIHEHVK